jgi:hypothetical protein
MADLMVPENPTEIVQRPDAPYDLDDDESAEWRAQVAAMPADHFTRNSFPMLAQLCRHVVASRRLAQLTQTLMNPQGGRGKKKDFDLKAYGALLDQQRKESAAITRLSRSMRLTQQSMTKSETVGRKVKNQMLIEAPWSKADEEET